MLGLGQIRDHLLYKKFHFYLMEWRLVIAFITTSSVCYVYTALGVRNEPLQFLHVRTYVSRITGEGGTCMSYRASKRDQNRA